MTDEDAPGASFRDRLSAIDDQLAAADTEAALDAIVADLDALAADIEAADLPTPDDEEETPLAEELMNEAEDLRDEIEEQRGPYAEDVADAISDVAGTVRQQDFTEQGANTAKQAIESFLQRLSPVEKTVPEATAEAMADTLDSAATAIEESGLHPDEDAAEIDSLLSLVDGLSTDIEQAEVWDDLTVREQLEGKGFYDVLDHRKDFPPEWNAVKVYEKRGDAESILLALEMLDSEFMQRHCVEALGRLGAEEAVDELLPLAKRRNETAIKALGSIGSADAVDTLVNHIDSGGALAITSLQALGEIGSAEALAPITDQLYEADDPDVRATAARALGMIGDPRAIDVLADVLAADEVGTVRGAAAWALRQIQTERALQHVREYTEDRTYLVQAEARQAAAALE